MKIIKFISVIVLLCFSSMGSFAAADPVQINLGQMASFAVFAQNNIDMYGDSYILGDVGLWGHNVTAPQIWGKQDGKVYGDSLTTYGAQTDLVKVIDQIKALNSTGSTTGNTGDQVFVSGVYDSVNDIKVSGTMKLDAQNSPDARFIFRLSSLTLLQDASIELVNGATPDQVYWLVNGSVEMKKNSKCVGTLIAMKDISLDQDASVFGRLISLTTQVKLTTNKITRPELPVIKNSVPKKVVRLTIGSKTAVVDGKPVQLDVEPVINNGFAFVPLSFVSKSLDGNVSFTKDSLGNVEMIIIQFDDVKAYVKIGSDHISVAYSGDNREIVAGSSPYVTKGRTMIPFKSIANILNANATFGMTPDGSRVDWVQFEK